METDTMNFGTVIAYIFLMLCIFAAGTAFGQNLCNSDICVVQFNASWNASNSVDYLEKLTDCEVMNVNIDEGTYQSDYEIVVVPTIIVFNGKEVERFQANIMMQIEATRKEVQNAVDEIIYSDF
jgi:hypothetical protein|tara:strand:- start:831 stop:1202 length:372 start_codon:yes stop_codon:yes gene_type:complete